MDELYMGMLELSSKGYYCSQILMKLILDLEGKENTDLIIHGRINWRISF